MAAVSLRIGSIVIGQSFRSFSAVVNTESTRCGGKADGEGPLGRGGGADAKDAANASSISGGSYLSNVIGISTCNRGRRSLSIVTSCSNVRNG